MERVALVTGAKATLSGVGRALERAGFAVHLASTADDLADVAAAITPATVSCYVQLSFEAKADGPCPLARLSQFLDAALMERCRAAALALPLLRPDAMVAFVGGDVAPDGVADDAPARLDLLRVVSRVMASSASAELKSLVLDADRSPEEIAGLAARRGEDRQWLHSRVTSIPSDVSFADWRQEFLGLAPPGAAGGSGLGH